MRWIAPLLLAGCVWISDDDEIERLDNDGDGFPFAIDCNDAAQGLSTVPFDDLDDLRCGDVVEGRVDDGVDLLGFTQCAHPAAPDALVELRVFERGWRFLSDVPTEVHLELVADNLRAVDLQERDGGDIALVANRGARCGVDRCVVGLPPAPDGWDEGLPAGPWRPSVDFLAAPGEPWAVVVSADSGEFTLTVTCAGG